MAARSKDPLTAATTSVLKPALAEHGFRRHTGRCFVRYQRPVAQFLDIQLSSWGSKDFAINYFILPLFPQRAFIGSNFAGRFPRGKSGDGWWPAKDHARADSSMEEIVEKFHSFAIPIYDASATIDGLIRSLKPMTVSGNSHILRDYAFSMIYAGDTSKGLGEMDGARNAFQKALGEMSSRDWCAAAVRECDRLAEACAAGEQAALFEQWIERSEGTLKLQEKAKANKTLHPTAGNAPV